VVREGGSLLSVDTLGRHKCGFAASKMRSMDVIDKCAKRIDRRLRGRVPLPSPQSLSATLRVLFAASFETEEAGPLRFHIVFLQRSTRGPENLRTGQEHAWRAFPFERALPLTVPNIAKVAMAADPRSSAFAVDFQAPRRPEIWGVVDQQGRLYRWVEEHNSEEAIHIPQMLRIEARGAGLLDIAYGDESIVQLRRDHIALKPVGGLEIPAAMSALQTGFDDHLRRVRELWPSEKYAFPRGRTKRLRALWISAVERLLIRIERFGHGGAILVTPHGAEAANLNIKYRLTYDRLTDALARYAVTELLGRVLTDQVLSAWKSKAERIPLIDDSRRYLNTIRHQYIGREIDEALWFVALLTRVDGAVVLRPNLTVDAFGVELMSTAPPSAVVRARSAHAKQTAPLDYAHFGTRHRSMMRWINDNSGARGFVISQDGGVRMFARKNGAVVMWDNLALRLLKY
jgi:hypothetical protein